MADKKINGSLEITGKLNPNASGYGFNLPSSASLTADKTIATEKYVDSALSSKADLVNGLVPAAQLPSYVDDVLESSDKDHFPSTGEKGKIYVALDTGYTYRWSGSEYVQIGGQDLSNFVTLDTDQTIAGNKRFSNTVYIGNYDNDYISITNGDLSIRATNSLVLRSGNNNVIPYANNSVDLGGSSNSFKDLYLNGKAYIGNTNYYLYQNEDGVNVFANGYPSLHIRRNQVVPANNFGLQDLGGIYNKWKDIYVSGNLSDGENSVSVADITSSTFNVINASDIVNNTLTQEQYNLITNGKPTLIKGVWSSYNNLILLPPRDNSTYFEYAGFDRYKTTKIVVYSDKRITTSKAAFIQLQNIDWINGKAIPGYPSSTGTFNFKYSNGALTWTEEWYGTQAEYDALGTYDDNTIYNITEE